MLSGVRIPAQWRQPLVSAAQTFNRERRMITKNGYLGLVPLLSLEGDLVCVIRVPVVLRRVLEHYVFVGECYVHGLMDGEEMQQV